jgi:hypothetical protein
VQPSRAHRLSRPAIFLTLTLVAAFAARSQAAEPPKAKPSQTPPAAAPTAPQAPAAERPAEEVFKNIKVLKGMPASQMFPVMHLIEASLGAQCETCHVTEGDRFDLDTKKEKETAREMISMTLAINKANFEGRTVVTCNTCHRGQEHPVRVPPIGQGLVAASHGEAHEENAKLPAATEVLDRYIQALGGRPALEGVKSRVSRGTLLHMKVADAGTPKARPVNRGQEDPLEIVQQAPDRVTVTVGPSAQQMVQRLEGASGTFQGPDGQKRPLNPQEIARLSSRTDLRKDLKLRERAEKARVVGREAVDGKDAFVVRMAGEDGTSQTLYFDVGTGLLRRQIINRPTVVGPDPEQTDFDDYRDVGGVKVPFTVKVSVLDDDRQGTTRKLTEVRDNEAAAQHR